MFKSGLKSENKLLQYTVAVQKELLDILKSENRALKMMLSELTSKSKRGEEIWSKQALEKLLPEPFNKN